MDFVALFLNCDTTGQTHCSLASLLFGATAMRERERAQRAASAKRHPPLGARSLASKRALLLRHAHRAEPARAGKANYRRPHIASCRSAALAESHLL